MGRPRKPRELKVLHGTLKPSRDNASEIKFESLKEVPAPPDWLPNAHAKKEWERLAPILVRKALLAEADLSSLGMLCGLHGKIVQLYAAGETPTASMATTLRGMQSDFGLSPAARSKVTLDPDGHALNKFSGNGRAPSNGPNSRKTK